MLQRFSLNEYFRKSVVFFNVYLCWGVAGVNINELQGCLDCKFCVVIENCRYYSAKEGLDFLMYLDRVTYLVL